MQRHPGCSCGVCSPSPFPRRTVEQRKQSMRSSAVVGILQAVASFSQTQMMPCLALLDNRTSASISRVVSRVMYRMQPRRIFSFVFASSGSST
eukprot:1809518-Rhodomonas_salina.3